MSLAPNTHMHVRPVMRHGILALAPQPLLLHLGPVVIGAPDGAGCEARLEGDRARRDNSRRARCRSCRCAGVDLGPRLEPVDRIAMPSARSRAVAGRSCSRSASPVPGWSTHRSRCRAAPAPAAAATSRAAPCCCRGRCNRPRRPPAARPARRVSSAGSVVRPRRESRPARQFSPPSASRAPEGLPAPCA